MFADSTLNNTGSFLCLLYSHCWDHHCPVILVILSSPYQETCTPEAFSLFCSISWCHSCGSQALVMLECFQSCCWTHLSCYHLPHHLTHLSFHQSEEPSKMVSTAGMLMWVMKSAIPNSRRMASIFVEGHDTLGVSSLTVPNPWTPIMASSNTGRSVNISSNVHGPLATICTGSSKRVGIVVICNLKTKLHKELENLLPWMSTQQGSDR